MLINNINPDNNPDNNIYLGYCLGGLGLRPGVPESVDGHLVQLQLTGPPRPGGPGLGIGPDWGT